MRNLGFTLVELMASLSIVAILLSLAVPGLSAAVQNNRLTAAVNELSRALSMARAQAISVGRQVVICKSTGTSGCRDDGGWEQGWMVFVDPNADESCADADSDSECDADGGRVILIQPKYGQWDLSLTATGNPSRLVAFNSLGFAEGYPGTFSVCDSRGVERARGLVLSIIGRIRVAGHSDTLHCPT